MKKIIKIFLIMVSVFIFLEITILDIGSILYKKDTPSWKTNNPELNQSMTKEQKIYYEVFKEEMIKLCPKKTIEEIDLICRCLVFYSKNIPYFAGVLFTESLRPRRRGRTLFWHNFTEKNDGGSPSYGVPKMKIGTINAVRYAMKEKTIKARHINISDPEWQIKLIKYAGYHFDNMANQQRSVFRGIHVYKFGSWGYKKYKKKHNYREPYYLSGHAFKKSCEYQKLFIEKILED